MMPAIGPRHDKIFNRMYGGVGEEGGFFGLDAPWLIRKKR